MTLKNTQLKMPPFDKAAVLAGHQKPPAAREYGGGPNAAAGQPHADADFGRAAPVQDGRDLAVGGVVEIDAKPPGVFPPKARELVAAGRGRGARHAGCRAN